VKGFVVLLVAVSCVLGLARPASAQSGQTSTSAASSVTSAQPTITFQFDRTGLSVPRYMLVLHEDGSGTYHAEEVERKSADSAVQQVSSKEIDRTLALSSETTKKIFDMAQSLHHFNLFCGTKAKNIVDTGKKTLTYSSTESNGSCTYNYSDDKNVMLLTEMLYAIAYTMDVGRRLDFERRFDHLGLDAELIALEHSLEEKNALEVMNIAPTLTAIANNMDLMQRVRTRAAKLLEKNSATK